MKIKYIRFLLWAGVILWMGVIFSFSSQNATVSSSLSGGTIYWIAELLEPAFKNMNIEQQESVIEDYQFIVRKTAHFTVYMVLGILTMSALFQHSFKLKQKVVLTIAVCSVYAAMDEIHQLFIQGRSGQLRDVFIDSCGSLIGMGLVILVVRIWLSRSLKNRSRKSVRNP